MGTYGGFDAKERGRIDWCMDSIATNFHEKYYKFLWYPVAGFGPPPDDQVRVNQECNDYLDMFEKKFMPNKKFIGGDKMNIADYKLGVQIWYINHPAIKAKVGYEVPMRFKRYVEDWQKALSPESQKSLEVGKGFLDTKL